MADIFSTKSDGGFSNFRPKKSFICVEKITTAIPFVKPIVTGLGMYFMTEPIFISPMANNIRPAIIVHIKRACSPYVATTPDIITTKAPVGPPI